MKCFLESSMVEWAVNTALMKALFLAGLIVGVVE